MSVSTCPSPLRLNLGCGRSILQGWINVDWTPLPGIDVVADLNDCAATPLPFGNDEVDEFLLSHVLEHVPNCLPLMQEMHRIAKPGATAWIRVPFGSSDDAWEDPTHVRSYFPGSFGYFSQPYYWRADYGYRGDWQPRTIVLRILSDVAGTDNIETLNARIRTERNVVNEMVAELIAIKPIREPQRELQIAPSIRIEVA